MNQIHFQPPATLYEAVMQLMKLASRYHSDCGVRISTIRDELASLGVDEESDDAADYRDQIEHWQATREMIQHVMDGAKPLVDTPPSLAES